MMRFEKMTKKDFFVFCVASVFGGVMIGIGGIGLLISLSGFEGMMGNFVGALIFSLAMFVVTTFGLYLITGLSTRIITMGVKNLWSLPVSLFFNLLGIGLCALLTRFSHVDVIESATTVVAKKMCESLEKFIEPTIRTINQRERYKIISLFENFRKIQRIVKTA